MYNGGLIESLSILVHAEVVKQHPTMILWRISYFVSFKKLHYVIGKNKRKCAMEFSGPQKHNGLCTE